MHSKKAFIFDLDGTLLNTLKSLWMATNLSLAEAGYPAQPLDAYRYFVGDGADELIRRALRAAGDVELEHFAFVRGRYSEIFKQYVSYEVAPYEGIIETLAELKNRGVKLAVNTNKPHERALESIKNAFGDGLFDLVVGQSAERARKPAPDGVRYILDCLSLDEKDAVYIGDTCVDIETGKNAGVFTVGALWGFRDFTELWQRGADLIVSKPADLLNI